jgi:hypothetical protein
MYYVRHSSPLLSPMLSVRWMAQAERIPRLCASSASHGTTVLRRITSSTRSQRRREKKVDQLYRTVHSKWAEVGQQGKKTQLAGLERAVQ